MRELYDAGPNMYTVQTYLSLDGWRELGLRVLTSWIVMTIPFGIGMLCVGWQKNMLSIDYGLGVGLFSFIISSVLTVTYIGISHPNETVSRFTWSVFVGVIAVAVLV